MPGNEPCPLCNSPASYTEIQLPIAGKRFECLHCKRFVIDHASEGYLARLPESARSDRRRALAELSSAAEPGKRLIIRAPYTGEQMSSVPVNGTNELISYIE